MAGMREETRDAFERVAGATREAVTVGVNAGRDAASLAGREISDRLEDASEAVDDASRTVRTNARKRNSS
jgi:hypothetical protein